MTSRVTRAEGKSDLGKTRQCGISNFTEGRKPPLRKRQMHGQSTGKLTPWNEFFTRNSGRAMSEALGGVPGYMEPGSCSCYSQRCLFETRVLSSRGFLPLSGAYQHVLVLVLIATEDPQTFGSFAKIWHYLLFVLPFCPCHCSFLFETS